MNIIDTEVFPDVEPESDKAYRLAETASSIIPFGGAIFKSLITAPFENRIEKWIEEVTDALNLLIEHHGKTLEELQNNEQFIDFVIGLSQSATRSSCREKLRYLKNALVNSAIYPMDVKDEYLFYLSMLDSFSAPQIRVLELIALDKNILGFDSNAILDQLPDYTEKSVIYKHGLKTLLSLELVTVTEVNKGFVYRLTDVGKSVFNLVVKQT
ncbi:hypothetical protein CW745_01085 [Psychromonas sp. psych-6C06]|uniref:hypothetical protein n=1 Tax=Psychromonas sp. psych-6C06 TaxID=2058089 RepID=UPI000C320CBD|nr:hypothetical protein [Psychromonas sp. psych-6C06]PKF63473.1 hypothetical protein CW745_01085 [Psychromonas sp. psych-6C06]